MTEIDLIPGAFRHDSRLRRQLRYFAMASVLVLVAAAGARTSLTYLSWREKAAVVRIEQQLQVMQHNEAQTEQLRMQRQVTGQQLAALGQLRGANRIAMLLRTIDAAYNDNIWLDSLHFYRREAAGAAAESPELNVAQGADMSGHATSHSRLADFMQQLGAQPAVADLRLISTGTRSYTNVQVVDFNLSLQVAGDAKEQP